MDTALRRVQNEMPCPICGQKADYTWGNATMDIRIAQPVLSFRQTGGEGTMRRIAVRQCNECRNLQFFRQEISISDDTDE